MTGSELLASNAESYGQCKRLRARILKCLVITWGSQGLESSLETVCMCAVIGDANIPQKSSTSSRSFACYVRLFGVRWGRVGLFLLFWGGWVMRGKARAQGSNACGIQRETPSGEHAHQANIPQRSSTSGRGFTRCFRSRLRGSSSPSFCCFPQLVDV